MLSLADASEGQNSILGTHSIRYVANYLPSRFLYNRVLTSKFREHVTAAYSRRFTLRDVVLHANVPITVPQDGVFIDHCASTI